jgi:hypothetical protein
MKKRTMGVMVLAIALVLALIPNTVLGQGFGLLWNSGISIANLTSNEATVSITFYPQGGGAEVEYVSPDPLPADGSLKFFPLGMLDDGFVGSAVVSSSEPVAAIVNQLTTGGGGSYEGAAEGSLEATLPIIMRGNGGYNTTFTVQNTGSVDADVDITFTPATYGNADTDGPFTIGPGRSMTFDQSGDTELGTRFVGSAAVSSSQPVVVAVNQVNPTAKVVLSYRGFSQGSPTASLPTIQSNNSGYFTGVAVKNVGSLCTDITVSFGPNIVGTFAPTPEEQTNVCAGESVNFNQWGGQWTERYVGSATVTNSEGQDVVVNVNQVGFNAPSQGSAYSAFNPEQATQTIIIPTLMTNNGGYVTAFLVQNVAGDGSTADFTVTFSTSLGSYTPVVETASGVADGEGVNFRQFAGQWTDPSMNNGARWVGSAVVECTQRCVAVVNQLSTSPTADTLLTYTGINK